MEQATYESIRTAPRGKLAFEEFLEWLTEDTHAEWVNGEVVPKMPVSVLHQRESNFLYQILSAWITYHQLGEVYHPPLLVRFTLPDGTPIAREPDLVVILNTNPGTFHEQYFEGAPDLIVEVISPSTRALDRHTKFVEYEAAGVREYWLIDPEREYAEFFQLDDAKAYRVAYAGSEGIYRCRVLEGLWLEVQWLWTRPSVWEVIQQWGLRQTTV